MPIFFRNNKYSLETIFFEDIVLKRFGKTKGSRTSLNIGLTFCLNNQLRDRYNYILCFNNCVEFVMRACFEVCRNGKCIGVISVLLLVINSHHTQKELGKL